MSEYNQAIEDCIAAINSMMFVEDKKRIISKLNNLKK